MRRAKICLSLINHCTDCTWKSESLKLRCSPLPVQMHIHWSLLSSLNGDRSTTSTVITNRIFSLVGCIVSPFPKKNSFKNSASEVFYLFVYTYNTLIYKWFTNYFAFYRGKYEMFGAKWIHHPLHFEYLFFLLKYIPYKYFLFSAYIFIFSVALNECFEFFPLGWSRNLDLKKMSCYYWHVFTWFRMELPTQVILCYFIFHVPDLNNEIGEWHCYS